MQTRIYFVFFVFSIFLLMQLLACKKGDYKDLENKNLCSIKKIIYKRSSSESDTAIFKYNSYGDPISVRITNVSTGYPNYEFRYDAMHRLTDFIEPYNNGQFDRWYKYIYGATGRVIRDTMFGFGGYNGGDHPSSFYYEAVNTYTYDDEGRISQVSTLTLKPLGDHPEVTTYAYDAAGNLIREGVTYDNKINFHRTNKVWQFVDKDYSVNNPLVAASYNPYLPLTFNSPSPLTTFFGSLRINQSQFFYDCKVNVIKIPNVYAW